MGTATGSGLTGTPLSMSNNTGSSTQPIGPLNPLNTKNYVIVQTPMKEKIVSKFLVDRCQRHHRVQISVNCICASTATDKAEALEEANALNDSLDGIAWKYNITGMNPVAAREYLEQNIQDFASQDDENGGGYL